MLCLDSFKFSDEFANCFNSYTAAIFFLHLTKLGAVCLEISLVVLGTASYQDESSYVGAGNQAMLARLKPHQFWRKWAV